MLARPMEFVYTDSKEVVSDTSNWVGAEIGL
jgi:hypothetical protein